MLRGTTITLYERVLAGTDDLNRPVYTTTPVQVENVLIAPVSAEEILSNTDLHGAKASYWLGLPKGDTHDWDNVEVSFFNQTFQTVGLPIEGIEEMVPTQWHKKVQVARYE